MCIRDSYKHKPNVDAVTWLIREIMPIVRKKLGDIPVYLLGSYPTPEICSLNSNTVFVPGYLADVNPYFINSRIFVAPLRYGAGMKGKIGQSLEYGLPIVSTSIGVEGMNLVDGPVSYTHRDVYKRQSLIISFSK